MARANRRNDTRKARRHVRPRVDLDQGAAAEVLARFEAERIRSVTEIAAARVNATPDGHAALVDLNDKIYRRFEVILKDMLRAGDDPNAALARLHAMMEVFCDELDAEAEAMEAAADARDARRRLV